MFSFFILLPFKLVAALYNRWTSINSKLWWDSCGITYYNLLDAKTFHNDECSTVNTKHTYNDFAISWKVLPIYLWFQRSHTSLSVWKYQLLLMRSTQRLLYVGQRMLPPCPFNMFSVKFCVLPLGPRTCWWYACKLHSKFSLPPQPPPQNRNIYSSICPVMKSCTSIYFSSIFKCHRYSKPPLYE